MKFSKFDYQRPDMIELKKQFSNLLERFNLAQSFEEQDDVIKEINKLRSGYESMNEIASIRYTIDTANEDYEKEEDFFNLNTPIYKEYISNYYKLLSNSRFRKQLEEKRGSQLFNIAELTVKTFSSQIIEDLQEENKLCSEYVKLLASSKIMFEGEERNLYGIAPFQLSKDRNMRKRAYEAKYDYMEGVQPILDDIYDKLVKIRTRIAKKLGYESFIELGYARLQRSDYDHNMVAEFRKQVQDYIVPIAQGLKERQQKRLKLDKLMYYDELYIFDTGNPVPKGNADWIIDNAHKMYSELSKETGEFFDYMIENELMDLLNKKGKAGGAYCTYISKYDSPFVFANFNGTSDDIDTLTHEAGHAFQAFCSRTMEVPEYYWPTLESCEIHSMGMEFLTWQWMELFFKEDTNKFKFMHLSKALVFIPYAATVDEFQHFVYANPNITPSERRGAWRSIEKKYLPHRDYGDNDYLESGGFWHQQGHIFEDPFYYIDYALAQICALQYWKMAVNNRDKAWESYMRLCNLGGSKSFVYLIKEAELLIPFNNECVKSVTDEVKKWLDSVDDDRL